VQQFYQNKFLNDICQKLDESNLKCKYFIIHFLSRT